VVVADVTMAGAPNERHQVSNGGRTREGLPHARGAATTTTRTIEIERYLKLRRANHPIGSSIRERHTRTAVGEGEGAVWVCGCPTRERASSRTTTTAAAAATAEHRQQQREREATTAPPSA